ncbi:ribonuclease H-like domain-containing protein [Tanacetum coccineum]
MTISTKNMFNVVDVSSLKLTVRHPDGTMAKITVIDSLRLTDNLGLFNVLVVSKYNVSLLSVNKMIKDSIYYVGFDESKCYMQDLKLAKFVRTRRESGGIYMFDCGDTGLVILFLKMVTTQFGIKVKIVRSDNGTEFVNTKVLNLFNGSERRIPLIYDKERSLSHLKAFGFLCYSTVLNNSDKFGVRDARFYETAFPFKMQTLNENGFEKEKTLAEVDEEFPLQPKIGENVTYEGNVQKTFHDEGSSIARNEPQTLLKTSVRHKTMHMKFNDFVVSSNVKKVIGCEWIFKIKYKGSGENDRYKASSTDSDSEVEDMIDDHAVFMASIVLLDMEFKILLLQRWMFDSLSEIDVSSEDVGLVTASLVGMKWALVLWWAMCWGVMRVGLLSFVFSWNFVGLGCFKCDRHKSKWALGGRVNRRYCSNYYIESSAPPEICDWCQSEMTKTTKPSGSSKKLRSKSNVGVSNRSEFAGDKIKKHDREEGSDQKVKSSSSGAPSPKTSTRRYKLLKDVMC